MEAAAIIIAVSGILVGISLATIAITWQIRLQSDKIDAIGERLSAEIRARGEILTSQRESLTETRLEQARLEGANLILRHQSHTHPPHNPPVGQEAAAD